MSVEAAVAEILALKTEFEALCEEAVTKVKALEHRLAEVDVPSNTQDVVLSVNLVHHRVLPNSPSPRAQLTLLWSFANSEFRVRDTGQGTGGYALLSDTDDWAFIELVAAIPRLLPKIQATLTATLPEKKLILASARAALEACETTSEVGEEEPETPARFQHIG